MDKRTYDGDIQYSYTYRTSIINYSGQKFGISTAESGLSNWWSDTDFKPRSMLDGQGNFYAKMPNGYE